MKKKKIQTDTSDIDLTPMLDVVFIMLIFFVVTASFLKEQSLPVYTPESTPPEQKRDSKGLLINISSLDEITVEQRRVDVRAIRSLTAQHMAENPEASVVVRAHEQSSTNTYVAIADQVQQVVRGNLMLTTYAD